MPNIFTASTSLRLGWGIALAWGVAFALCFDGAIVYALGIFTGLAAIVLLIGARPALQALFPPAWTELLWGAGAGLLMAALTYLLFPVFTSLFPALKPNVTVLYQKLFADPGPKQLLPIILWVVLMEEVVFRGILLPPTSSQADLQGAKTTGSLASLWQQLRDPMCWRAIVVATIAYTLVHIGSGSMLLCLLAFVCGLVWGWMRVWRGSLWMALTCHLVWDLLVFVYYPLVPLG